MTIIGIVCAAIVGAFFWSLARPGSDEGVTFMCLGIISMIFSWVVGVWILEAFIAEFGYAAPGAKPNDAVKFAALPFGVIGPVILYFIIKKKFRFKTRTPSTKKKKDDNEQDREDLKWIRKPNRGSEGS